MPLVLALGISIAALNNPNPAVAAIYRCTNAAGEDGFSDEPCPAGFTSDALDIQSRPARSASDRMPYDPYSPIEQVKQLERDRERQAQLRREREALSERRPQTADIEPRARNGTLEAGPFERAEQARAEQAQREAQARTEQARREAQLRLQEAKKQAQAEEQRANAKSWHTKEPQPGAPAPKRSW
jgi:hypothetical protein